jgi:hypothetical protein
MSEWQTIDSAPKDGRDILIIRFGREAIPTFNVVWWDDSGRWGKKYPWRFVESRVGGYNIDFPTHWMPLPEPPQ